MAHALEHLRAFDGRGVAAKIEAPFGASCLWMISYNANPGLDGRGVLQLLAARKPGSAGGRRIAPLEDMLELGPDERAYHAGLFTPAGAGRASTSKFAQVRAWPRSWRRFPPTRRGGYARNGGRAGFLKSLRVRYDRATSCS